MLEKPAFIQGLFTYKGAGLAKAIPFQPRVTYLVPPDKRSQMIYFRAGNAAPEMVYLALMRRGGLMRYFPIGAKGAVHVPLAVVEDLTPETELELLIAAPEGLESLVLVDVGFMEIG